MKEIKQESGRSMVEMLGVLAVIGVLSVGGISGYTLAMNKHRANSVAADLMKRAVVISAQRQLGQEPNVQGLGNQVGDYSLDSNISKDDANQTFAMTVQAVPQEVCEKILALDWDNATISPDTAEGCDGGDMTFTYKNDLSPVTGSNAGGSTGGEEPTCTGTGNGCQKCENGEWVADTDKNGEACGEGGVCANGACAVVCDPHESEECCLSVTITDGLDNRHFVVDYYSGEAVGCYNYLYRLEENGDGTYKAGTTVDSDSCQNGFLAEEGYCCEYNSSGPSTAQNLGGFLNNSSQLINANEACLYQEIVRHNSTYVCWSLTANDLDGFDAQRKYEILSRCGIYEVNGSFYNCSEMVYDYAPSDLYLQCCSGSNYNSYCQMMSGSTVPSDEYTCQTMYGSSAWSYYQNCCMGYGSTCLN